MDQHGRVLRSRWRHSLSETTALLILLIFLFMRPIITLLEFLFGRELSLFIYLGSYESLKSP